MYDYFDILGRMVEFIEEFEKDILGEYFDDEKSDKAGNEYFCFTPRYCQHWQPIKDIISVCDFFGIERLEHMKKNLLMHIDFLCHYEIASQKVYSNVILISLRIVFVELCQRLKTD